MSMIKKISKRILKAIIVIIFRKSTSVDKEKYSKWLFLPNRLSTSLKHEEFLNDIYKIILAQKKGDVFDVGVNTGQSLIKILHFDKNRSYFGFEPQSMAAASIESFLVENKITNFHVIPIALSDCNGVIPIHTRGEGIYSLVSSAASIVETFRPPSFYDYTRYVYAVRGDDIVKTLGVQSISLVKIDVEGAELEVLRGLKNSIMQFRPFILFEVLHHYVVTTGQELDKTTIDFRESRLQELEKIIRTSNYQIYQIHGWHEIVKVSKIQPKTVNDLSSTDFVAVPEEHELEFYGRVKMVRRIRN